jgi:ureidoacrylate peracid hydrolase
MNVARSKIQRRVSLPARPDHLEVVLEETALIVVDMQNAYLSKGGYLDLVGFDVSKGPEVIAATKTVIDACRAAGIKIIFLQNGFETELREASNPASPVYHKSNALKYMRAHPQYNGKLITKGTWDFELVQELRPHPDEIVINKARYSGFAGTNLDMMLRAHRINALLIAGVNANVCVESTLRDAYHREYFAVLVADATYHAGPSMMMDATVFNVEKFFGWVSTVDEVCRALPRR